MRSIVVAVLVGVSACVPARPAGASECPELIRKIHAHADRRFDRAAYDAKDKAAQAARLHAEGRHDDAQKIAREGLQRLHFDTPPPPPSQPTP